jgi:hypothetical protein
MALTDNLIAQYALDSDLVDSVGSFDGTNSGATFETAAGRSFASFDAADRAFLGTDFQFGAEDFTYSFWMNPEATQENYAMVFASYAEVYTGYYFVQDALNHNKYWFRGNGGSTWQPYSSTVDIPANSWTHVTIVRTGTTVSLYTNGSLAYQDTNAVASTISYGSSNPQLTLGGVSNSNAYNGWAGDLDDFRVWTRALDASEIATLYSDNVLLSDGLALHFAGDDGVDDIGGVVATTNGITFVQDEGRDAWDLGTEGVASFTRPFTIGGANDWSMSVWFKNKNSTASSPLLRGSYYWLYANSNSLGIWTSSLQDTGYDLVPADLQGWHQITAVGTTNLTTYYIDGVEVGSVATNPSDDGTSNFGTPNQLFLGAEWNGQNAWAEMISDFRMYNRALDSGEVSALYAETDISDSEAPVITMLGDNPMNLEPGDAFADPGATAVDNFDGAVSVVASGGDNISLSDDWIQVPAYPTMPTINGDGSLSFFYSSHVMARKENDVSAGDFEIVVEFDNNNTGSGDFGMSLIDGSNIVVFRQQAYNAWGANNSFFFGLWNGSSYLASGAGPAQLASGAMKIAREGTIYKFYSSSDKVSFTEMGQFDASALGWTPGDLELRVQAGSRSSVDVTGFSRSDISEGAQEGSYTITYTAQDAAGNVATAQRSVVVEVAVTGYSWDHQGQLTNIVKFVQGLDLDGNRSFAYAKKEDDGSTTLYFTPDLTNFAAVGSYDSGASSIDGSPVCIEYGAGGKVAVGTDTGKVYQIELDGNSIPQGYTLLHEVVGGHPVNSLKYGFAMNVWIFEAGEDIYTIPAAGGGAVMRHALPAGAKVVDFAEGDDGKVAFIVRLADFSLEPRVAPADWSVVYGPSSMVADAAIATDFNYSHAMDLWVSSNADGSAFTGVGDLLDLLK